MKIEINIDEAWVARTGRRLAVLGLLLGLAYPAYVTASTVTIPNTFTAGSVIRAADFNANFTAVKTAVDDNDTRITALESAANVPDRTVTEVALTNLAAGSAASLGMSTDRSPESAGGAKYTLIVQALVSNAGTLESIATPGNLVLDLVWFKGTAGEVRQNGAVVLNLDAGITNLKTVTVTGTWPARPTANPDGGLPYLTNSSVYLEVSATGVTAALGASQSIVVVYQLIIQ
jgi:hypothetical protein